MKFAGWTEAGHLRAPVFLRLRDDVDPKTVRRGAKRARAPRRRQPAGDTEVDQVLQQLEDKRTTLQLAVGAARIKLTHLDRVYWPADRRVRPAGADQAGPAALPRARVPLHAAASRRPAADDDPHAGGHRRRAVLPEALGPGAARVRPDGHRSSRRARTRSRTTCSATICRRSSGSDRRDARVPRLALAAAGPARMRRAPAPISRARSKRWSARS